MPTRSHLPALLPAIAALGATLLAGCQTTGSPPKVAVAPICVAHAVSFNAITGVESALVSERTSADSRTGGFTRFRSISDPRGNPAVGFFPDVYGFSEVASRNPSGPLIYRAQSHPAQGASPSPNTPRGSAWTVHVQDSTGTWSAPIAQGTAHAGNEVDTPAIAGPTVPQLMAVGVATPEVFACAGERSEDNAVRSTWLMSVSAANPATGSPASFTNIQDLLQGDERFVRNLSVPPDSPLANVPPSPRISGRPGDPIREGSVQCAMVQFEDNVSTRELHMLAIRNGVLYHSMANNFGATTRGTGGTYSRFRTVSTWGDVGSALGGNFGNIISAAVVARPRAIHVLFVAEKDGLHKLWHAVRFSANGGSWRPAEDVMAAIAGFPRGRVEPFRVAAGLCEAPDKPQESEVVYTTWTANSEIKLGRIASTSRQWVANIFGIYSNWSDLSGLLSQASNAPSTIDSMTIGMRPFSDNARP